MRELKYPMRLQPKFKRDKNGNKTYDHDDENGNGQYVSRKWYSRFRWKGKYVNFSLHAYEGDWRTAMDNLVLLKEDLKQGKTPNGTRKQIKNIKTEKPLEARWGGIRINYIIPCFGEYTVNELTPQLIEQYLESRWGRDSEGNLQAMEATWVIQERKTKL